MNHSQIPLREIELLSAYLDGQLDHRQQAGLEKRLQTHPELRAELEGLRQTRFMLRSLPRLRAPRNFTISPQTAGIRPASRLPAIFGAVSAFSSALLVLLVIGTLLLRTSGQPVAMPASAPSVAEDVEMFSVEAETPISEEFSAAMAQEGPGETPPMLGEAFPTTEDANRSAEPNAETGLVLPASPTPTNTMLPPSATPTLPSATPTPTSSDSGIEMVVTPTESPIPTNTSTPLPTPSDTPVPSPTPSLSPTATEVVPSATPMILALAPTESPMEQSIPEGQAEQPSEKIPLSETPPTAPQPPTALIIAELILTGIALLTGLTALALFIRSRR